MTLMPEQQQRADEVWKRLIGLFGGEAVKRKYGGEMPAEWRGVISKLNAVELDRGMRRLVHSGRDQVPTLPSFVRLCRSIGADDINEGPQNLPRIAAPVITLREKWERAGNRHLFAHLCRRICQRQSPYGEGEMEDLRRARDAWTADMMDLAANHPDGEVPIPLQQSCWKDYIEAADREITARRAHQEAA